MSKVTLRLSGVGVSSHRNLLEARHHGDAACTSNFSGSGFRKVSVIKISRGSFGKRKQARSWVRVSAKAGSGDVTEKESGKQSGVTLKDGLSQQGLSRFFSPRRGEVQGDGISNSEYQKIQDLKFSGDLWEGDSGPQVLDLQRMLYWFGYLPKRTELTAYFGIETKKALQQFQIAHGVSGTGAWGSSSRQALWKILSEDSDLLTKGGSSVYINLQQPISSSVDNDNAEGTNLGVRVSELLNNMGAHSQEFVSTLSTASYWNHLPTNVPRNAAIFGLLVGVLISLFSLGYSVVGFFHEQQNGTSVRRRVLRAQWRDDMSGGPIPMKSKRHLESFPGLDLPLVGDDEFRYRLRSKSKPSAVNGAGRTDRLILYEGQVLVGDETPSVALPFMSGPASRRGSGKMVSQAPPRAKPSVITGQTAIDQTSKPVSNGSISGRRDSKLSKLDGNSKNWQDKDEENFKNRVEELRKAVQATEKNRQAAMRALAEERQRSLELQVKISRQKETAAALEEEVRVLKESHDALLASLRKKYSSSVAARAAAALLYQNWDTEYEEGSPQTLSF